MEGLETYLNHFGITLPNPFDNGFNWPLLQDLSLREGLIGGDLYMTYGSINLACKNNCDMNEENKKEFTQLLLNEKLEDAMAQFGIDNNTVSARQLIAYWYLYYFPEVVTIQSVEKQLEILNITENTAYGSLPIEVSDSLFKQYLVAKKELLVGDNFSLAKKREILVETQGPAVAAQMSDDEVNAAFQGIENKFKNDFVTTTDEAKKKYTTIMTYKSNLDFYNRLKRQKVEEFLFLRDELIKFLDDTSSLRKNYLYSSQYTTPIAPISGRLPSVRSPLPRFENVKETPIVLLLSQSSPIFTSYTSPVKFDQATSGDQIFIDDRGNTNESYLNQGLAGYGAGYNMEYPYFTNYYTGVNRPKPSVYLFQSRHAGDVNEYIKETPIHFNGYPSLHSQRGVPSVVYGANHVQVLPGSIGGILMSPHERNYEMNDNFIPILGDRNRLNDGSASDGNMSDGSHYELNPSDPDPIGETVGGYVDLSRLHIDDRTKLVLFGTTDLRQVERVRMSTARQALMEATGKKESEKEKLLEQLAAFEVDSNNLTFKEIEQLHYYAGKQYFTAADAEKQTPLDTRLGNTKTLQQALEIAMKNTQDKNLLLTFTDMNKIKITPGNPYGLPLVKALELCTKPKYFCTLKEFWRLRLYYDFGIPKEYIHGTANNAKNLYFILWDSRNDFLHKDQNVAFKTLIVVKDGKIIIETLVIAGANYYFTNNITNQLQIRSNDVILRRRNGQDIFERYELTPSNKLCVVLLQQGKILQVYRGEMFDQPTINDYKTSDLQKLYLNQVKIADCIIVEEEP